MAMVVLRLMIDGTDCLVNAIADPERTATPSIAQKIFMMVNACVVTEDFAVTKRELTGRAAG